LSAVTIFALSSAPGKAGIAVLRVSGPQAAAAARALSGRAELPARKAVTVRLRDPRSGETLDHGLVLLFKGKCSYTGEDLAEFHVHGGRAVVAGVVDALASMPGLRPAAPGEFTRRAFEHGKLDLTAAEAIADLVEADTAVQRRQALRQQEGALAALYDGWGDKLLQALSLAEAAIDFAEEELPGSLYRQLHLIIDSITPCIKAHLSDAHRGERLRAGLQLVILGPPNAGKSSLLNILARREAAIVAATAGTTRDVIEVSLDLGGYPVTLADTAGLRDSAEDVESEGVRRARARAESADLKILLFDGEHWPALDATTAALIDDRSLAVLNKSDLLDDKHEKSVITDFACKYFHRISCLTGVGIDDFLQCLEEEIARRYRPIEDPVITRARHREALEECLEALERYLSASGGGAASELGAEDLRLAARSLGRITGRVEVEDILDRIFGQFCIGK